MLLKDKLTQDVGLIMVLKITGMFISMLASIFYARILGAENYGIYAFAMASIALCTIPAELGMGAYLLREISKKDQRDWAFKAIQWADHRLILAGLFSGFFIVILAKSRFVPDGSRMVLQVGSLIPIVAVLIAPRISVLKAYGKIISSQWPMILFIPLSILTYSILTKLVFNVFTPELLVSGTLFSTVIAFIIIHRKMKKINIKSIESSKLRLRLKSALPFMFLGVLGVINNRTDIVMLGALSTPENVGIYRVASRTAEVVMFPLLATNTIIGPQLSALFHNGEIQRLQNLLTITARRMFFGTLGLALPIILLSPWIIEFVFGLSYKLGGTALRIISFGQIINVSFGSVVLLLNMTGNELITAKVIGLAAVMNIALNLIFIPRFGIEGAAIASICSIFFWNIFTWGFAKSKLKINTAFFSKRL